MTSHDREPFNVLIAGGGIAGLEAALALRELAGDRAATTLIAPDPDFVYRPMRVREPFGYSLAQSYPLQEIADDIGVELRRDAFKWLDAGSRVVHTEDGQQLHYDALLLALGAQTYPRLRHALTLDSRRLDEQLHGLIQDVEGGYVSSLAFVIPSRQTWPLPAYELALMTARRAADMGQTVSVTLITPEDAPLAIFGQAVSDAVARELEKRHVRTITSAHCEAPAQGQLAIHPGSRTLSADRVVALPELRGPASPGVPKSSPGGFIPVDVHGRVRGLERVYAAGDATDFAVKHGGLAAQQADAAAESIAVLAGAPIEPRPFHPVIHGILLGGDHPLHLSAHITGGHGSSSEVSQRPNWSPGPKVVARYLGPYLDSRDRASLR